MLPPLLDERSKELLREFGAINGSAYVRPEPQPASRAPPRGNPGPM